MAKTTGCVQIHEDDGEGRNHAWTTDSSFAVRFGCDHDEVNELASLWFAPRENVIKKILAGGAFSASSLFYCGCLAFATLLLVFGTALPGGLVSYPLIYCGACLGGAAARSTKFENSKRFQAPAQRHLGVLGSGRVISWCPTHHSIFSSDRIGGDRKCAYAPTDRGHNSSGALRRQPALAGFLRGGLALQKIPFLEKHVPSNFDRKFVADVMKVPVVLTRLTTASAASEVLHSCSHGAFRSVE